MLIRDVLTDEENKSSINDGILIKGCLMKVNVKLLF